MEVSASHIHARFPAHATLLQSRGHIRYGYGTFTLSGCAVPGNFTYSDIDKRLQTTSPSLSFRDSACPVPFSFATTHGISLISIPPPTKMLQFGGFPIASRLFPKKQEVPFSHLRIQDILASPRSLSQLVTTFIGTRAERSPSWVVASHVCYHTMRVTLRYLIHANSASTKDQLL